MPFRAKGFDVARRQAVLEKGVDRIRNGYWLAHRLLKSRARVYYGDIYNIPDEIGQFDVVFLGMVLPHLREPFYALAQTARLSRDAVIITQQAPKDQAPIAYFIPNARMNPDSRRNLRGMVGVQRGMLPRDVAGAGLRNRVGHLEEAHVHRTGSRWRRGVHDHRGPTRAIEVNSANLTTTHKSFAKACFGNGNHGSVDLSQIHRLH